MPAISVERTIGKTKRAVLGGLIRYNTEKMGKQKYRRFAISLRDDEAIVGGIVGEVWMTVLFIQFFWIEERFRGQGHGTTLIEKIEAEAKRFGAVRSYLAEPRLPRSESAPQADAGESAGARRVRSGRAGPRRGARLAADVRGCQESHRDARRSFSPRQVRRNHRPRRRALVGCAGDAGAQARDR